MSTEELPRRWPHARNTARDLLQMLAEALLLFLIVSVLTGRFEVHQVSMEPNLHEGQRVVVSKLEKLWPTWLISPAEAATEHKGPALGLQHGQIVVLYKSPTDRAEDPLIKRIIALPGETLFIRDDAVYVDGAPLDERYIHGARTSCNSYCSPLTLGADQYFVMGDNRPNSLDSRTFGPISGEQIIGRVILRYWPLNQLAFYP